MIKITVSAFVTAFILLVCTALGACFGGGGTSSQTQEASGDGGHADHDHRREGVAPP